MSLENLIGLGAAVGALGTLSIGVILLIIAALIWKLIWYGLALYKTIGKKQKAWFVVLFVAAFVLNDLGILPIIYLLIYQEKKAAPTKKKKR